MKNILKKFKISSYTYLFVLICFLCGYLKNILIIMSICLIHELGHIFFIKLFKYEIIKMELLPFGGFTTINEPINSNINKDLFIAFGGIFFQLIFIMILFIFKNHFNLITYNLYLNYNLILIIFNLIPIIPLDGSKISELFLEKFFSYHYSYHLNFYLSIFSLLIFTFINYKFKLDNYFIISFLIYKTLIYLKDYHYLQKRFLLERYLYNLEYQKIDNHTKNIQDLKKNVFHYFKENNRYINEKEKIAQIFDKKANF